MSNVKRTEEEAFFNTLTPEMAQRDIEEILSLPNEHPDYEVYFPKKGNGDN